MDKQKEIEEMVKDFKSYLPSAWYHDKCVNGEVYSMVKHAYEDNYRKIDKDSVVLTETERIAMCVEQWDKGYERGSKETAEKILNELYCTPKEQVEKRIKELARFIGVEIKE